MKKHSLRFVAVILTFVLIYSLCATSVSAVTTTCITYSGSNKEAQNYQTWSKPMYSYLTHTSEGKLMTVQHIDRENYAVVTYYDKDYNYLSEKSIAEELPLFGGFYETASNYYIVSGQENPKELSDVECFRITKYDKNWNRISSAGLFDCNTTVPFDAGCVRVSECEKYLVIRTSHEMYKTSDGLNHQANVTIQLDTDSMKITDSYTTVMNVGMGYVSHSFNQFIKVENNSIVAVDHGDANPRSIVLCKYNTDLSDGTFADYYGCCTPMNFIEIPGGHGNNYTGASVGGFEISSTDYIVAGSAVDYDSYVDYSWASQEKEIRNIFVSTIDKATNEVSTKYITSYSDGDSDASTPQLVRTGDDAFMLFWSRDNTVYYTQLDGEGNCVGSIKSIEGNLSDCVPVVINGEVMWYVWSNNIIDFYSVNLSTQEASVTEIENGHRYTVLSAGNGKVTLECSACGKTETAGIFTEINVLTGTREYNNGGYSFSGWYGFDSEYKVGDRIDIEITHKESDEFGKCIDESVVTSSDPSIAVIKEDSFGNKYIDILKSGTVTITIGSKYDPVVSKSYTITVPSVAYDIGDVNGDDSVSIDDVTEIQKYLANLTDFTAEQETASDVNRDGSVSIDDATLIQKAISGIVAI